MGKSYSIPSETGEIPVYEVQPAIECRGGLIVIHEVWGLTNHIKDIADRFANEGYMALAPDLLSEALDLGKITGMQNDLFNPKTRSTIQPKLREMMAPIQNPSFAKETIEKLKFLFDHLYKMPELNQKIAVVGFCFGGTYSFSLALHEPRLKLALPFYGHSNSSVEELAAIKCPVRAFYGENDKGLVNDLAPLKDKMSQAGVDFEATVYPNCGHAFFNDTNPFAYNEEAARDAWQRTLSALKRHLAK